MTLLILILLYVLLAWLLYVGRPLLSWTLPPALGFLIWYWCGVDSPVWYTLLLLVFAAAVVLFAVPSVRRAVITKRAMPLLAPLFPSMSDTEREALEAGSVWWDAELFSGAPRWKKLLDVPESRLSDRERAFLEGPCEELCRMLDDWQILQDQDLPGEIWEYMGEKGFFGIIIPTEYGGLGFSAIANSAVVTKLSSRSCTAAVTVMVPNSLGPAELLLHYGTKEQKDHYLPRLAVGKELPCFALTEPFAGSDAGSMRSGGVVTRGMWKGEEVLGMRLNWEKRYITLNAVATVIGLAFKLRDPDGLLGGPAEVGITCALIPADTPGVEAIERHDPLGVPFVNGTTRGKDVFVPLDFIIGGRELAGQGWRMLMDCLAAGRGISLPALSVGAAELTTRTVGAYASVREQFNMPIGGFEGIQERLAPIAGLTYLMDATRRLTATAIDAGQKPAVITAISKAYLTEGMREVVNHGMDVVGGAGIVRGPHNILAAIYQAAPIGITVEGANILTRSMIIFGQGAIRCHPYALEEMQSVAAGDLNRFDAALFGHGGAVVTNWVRAAWLGFTDCRLARRPRGGHASHYFPQFERMSATFAVCAEAAMMTLGGDLKRREALTGRLSDALAWLYMGTASLKRFYDEGQAERDEPFVDWAAQKALFEIEQALLGMLDNLPNRWVARLVRLKLFMPWSRYKLPHDRLARKVAHAIQDGGAARLHLTPDIFVPHGEDHGLALLEHALAAVVASRGPERKIKDSMRAGKLDRGTIASSIDKALEAGVISTEEARVLREAGTLRDQAVQVDAFDRGRPPVSSGSRSSTSRAKDDDASSYTFGEPGPGPLL
ncbi:MAG: acyl-CoA dehydrogenase [Planctomycetes bacterium]|nr:acyl-CoA dehydrogenase [Planctomycetota bacterium]MCB9903230.1 acyl-CoA dehydrogenase [Planctomycetota bacterium]